MTDDNSNSFAERLKRIEENNPNAGQSQPDPSDWVHPPVRRKSGISGTAVGIVLCGGVIIGAGTYAYMQLPKDALQFAIGGPSAIPAIAALQQDAFEKFQFHSHLQRDDATGEKFLVDTAEELDPALYDRVQGRIGHIFGATYAATADTIPVSINGVFADFAPMDTDTSPRSVAQLTANADCTLRAVAPGETLVNVNIRHSRDLAPLQFADDSDVVETLQDAVSEALEDGIELAAYPDNPNGTGVINVMVTDTSGPLYLALQTLGQNTMWRIHAAPDVDIAHVALIGPGSAGFAGNIGDASYEMVRAEDFYHFGNRANPYDFHDEPAEMECMTRPFREPNATWGAWAGSEGGNTMDGNLLFGQQKGFAAYQHWFETETGANPQSNLVEAYIASHVLVGPMPETPLAAPPAPETWYFADHDHIFAGSADDRSAQYNKLTADLAVAASGGDPFAILPPETVISTLDPGVTLATVSGELPTLMGRALHRDPVPARISLDEYNSHRTVEFEELLSFADLLTPGETPPPVEHMDLYAMMRATMAFADRCAPAVADIATGCKMVSADVTALDDGNVAVKATFGYLPRYELGHFERSTRNDFNKFAFWVDAADQQYLNPAEQAVFVDRLRQVCDAVRAERGNCIISEVSFTQQRNSSSRALGRVAVYQQDYNKFEQSQTKETVDAAFATSVRR